MINTEVYAIIPARGGSKGVPHKNVKLLAGYPLIAYSIAAARLCPQIKRVIVSTDSQEIADVSRRYNAEVPFLRPFALAGDYSPDRDFVLHALRWFEDHEGQMPEYLVHLRPTTPVRDPSVIGAAIGRIMADPLATSLRSGHEAPESPYKWFLRDERGYFHGLKSDETRPDYTNLPRQMFPAVYIPDGYVDVLRTSFLLESDDLHGDHIVGYVSPRCVEVDTLEDFEYLEFHLNKAESPLLDFLAEHHPSEA